MEQMKKAQELAVVAEKFRNLQEASQRWHDTDVELWFNAFLREANIAANLGQRYVNINLEDKPNAVKTQLEERLNKDGFTLKRIRSDMCGFAYMATF